MDAAVTKDRAQGLVAWVAAWRARRAKVRERRAIYQRTMGEMAAMSPAEQAEFGVTRAAFERFAWEKAFRAVPE